MFNDIDILKGLVNIPSPSGYEDKLATYIAEYLEYKNVEIDFHNNVIVTIDGINNSYTIMIDAHLDQLGFLVNNIDKDGIISMIPIGGHDKTLLRGREVLILTKRGTINGVIDIKPIHLIRDIEEELPERICHLPVDIGIRKKEEVEKIISLGNPVILNPLFAHLTEDYYYGYGFDDKAGCYILMKTIESILQNGIIPQYKLIFTFSCQEEIGCKGAKEMVTRYKPNEYIGVDVTFATDYPEIDERETGKCEVGKGIVIYNGINIDKDGYEFINDIAKHYKIPHQCQVTNSGGFNADEIANDNGGIKILNLGIPLRNMHSPVEVLNINDLNSGIKLLTRYLSSLIIKS